MSASGAGTNNRGYLYVYKYSGSSWSLSHTIQGYDYNGIGYGLAISGNTIATGKTAGAIVYVYEKDDGAESWSFKKEIFSIDADYSRAQYFGRPIDIDGDYMIIGDSNRSYGEMYEGGTLNGIGCATVYRKYSDSWIREVLILDDDLGEGDYSGDAVRIGSDGIAIVGCWREDVGADQDKGAVCFFKAPTSSQNVPITYIQLRNPAQRDLDLNDNVQISTFTYSVPWNTNTPASGFTYRSDNESVATVNSSGLISPVAIGSTTVTVETNDPIDADSDLAVTTNDTRIATTDWIATSKRTRFSIAGSSGVVDIDGNYVIAVSPLEETTGRLYVFKNNSGWSLHSKLEPTSTYSFMNGSSATISGDYIATVVGRYTPTSDIIIIIYKKDVYGAFNVYDTISMSTNVSYISSIQLDISGNYLIVSDPYDDSQKGKIFIYHNNGSSFDDTPVFTLAGNSSNTYFGSGVCINGDYAIASDQRAHIAYVFKNTSGTWSTLASFSSTCNQSALNQVQITSDGNLIALSNYFAAEIWKKEGSSYSSIYSSGIYGIYPNIALNKDYFVFAGCWAENNYYGQAKVLKRDASTAYTEKTILKAHDKQRSLYFGGSGNAAPIRSIAIDQSKQQCAIMSTGTNMEAVYIFELDPILVTSQTVTNPAAIDPDLNGPTIAQLVATAAPSNATNKNVTWTSGDETKAVVDIAGKVYPVASGSATITATSNDESTQYDDISVTVASTTGWSSNFTGWTKKGSDIDSNYSHVGRGVATEGVRFAVGYPYSYNNNYGGAMIFKPNGSALELEAELKPTTGNGNYNGSCIDMDSSQLIMGGAAYYSTRAFIYKRSGTTWSLKATLTETGASSWYASSVSISGNYAVVGDGYGNSNAGRIYVYKNDGSDNWSLYQTINAPNSGTFGMTVAIRGNYIVVGAYAANSGGTSGAGEAYVYNMMELIVSTFQIQLFLQIKQQMVILDQQCLFLEII
jgi:hypothetical protein